MKNIRTIAVLGGTGFVGQRLIAQLANNNYHVLLPTRKRENFRHLQLSQNISVIQADVHDQDALNRILRNCEAVINLVGVLHDSKNQKNNFAGAHVELCKKVISTCQHNNITRLIHMSALNADVDLPPSKYLQSKAQAETLVKASNLDYTIFRPSVIFGHGDSFINRFASLVKIPNPFFVLPMSQAKFNPVHIDDVVKAFIEALKNPSTIHHSYNLCGPKTYTLREIIQNIANSLGKKRYVIGLNKTLSSVAGSILGVFPGKPFTKDNYLSMTIDSICSINGFKELQITPKSLENHLDSTLNGRSKHQRYNDYRKHSQKN